MAMAILFKAGRSWWKLLLLILLGVSPAAAQVKMSATLLLGPVYMPGTWTPARVEISNESDALLEGVLSLQSDHLNAATDYQQEISIPARARAVVFHYACLGDRHVSPGPNAASEQLALVVLKTRNGAEKARAGIVAEPVHLDDSVPAYLHGREPRFLLMVGEGHTGNEKALCGMLSETAGLPLVPTRTDPSRLPLHSAGYDAVAVVWLGEVDPDEWNEAQRLALRQFVESGGVVIVSALTEETPILTSWLAGWIPVQVVGHRTVAELPVGGLSAVGLDRRDARISDALPADGVPVLEAQGSIHAAYRNVGLGRVIFTSFPIAEADWRLPVLTNVLERLWPTQTQNTRQVIEQVAMHAPQAFPRMIGRRTLAWAWAVGWCIAFVLLSASAYVLFRGVRRAAAMLSTAVVGVVLALGLLIGGRPRNSNAEILVAAVSGLTTDSQSGATWQSDAFCFLGPGDASITLAPRSLGADYRPIQADARVLKVSPFLTSSVQMSTARIDSVWMAGGRSASAPPLDAKIEFAADSPTLAIRNDSQTALEDAVLVWDESRAWRLGKVPPGETRIRCERGNQNSPGSCLGTIGVVGEESRIRAAMLEAASAQRTESLSARSQPMIFGWLAPTEYPPLLAKMTSPQGIIASRMVFAAAPVNVMRQSGLIRLPDPFCRLEVPPASTLPFDPHTLQWQQTSEQGVWRFGIRPPVELGHPNWQRMRIEMEVIAPRQQVTLRRVPSAAAGSDEKGEEIGRFTRTVSAKSFSIDMDGSASVEGDPIWFELSAEQLDGDAEQAARSQWHVRRFEFILEGSVQGK